MWVAPALVTFIAALVLTTFYASQGVVEDIYLELATRRAEGIAQGVARSHPREWKMLVNGRELGTRDFDTLVEAFNVEREEFGLEKLKVYDLHARTIFSTDATKIGEIEDNPAINGVLKTGQPGVLSEQDILYELYVPYRVDGQLVAVFEIYEPTTYLNQILRSAALPVVLVPGLMLIVLLASLGMLVASAQRSINSRTAEVNSLRQRLEGLVSRRAVQAMRHVDGDGVLAPESIACTLLYTDVRGFTSYCEDHTPAQVIDFLNIAMTAQISIIELHGGDVDKLIGDAVFAHFHGDDSAGSALRAAIEIQQVFTSRGISPGVGIGVYSGEVIAGGIGDENRRDYTVIGDSVNISARLCALAAEGEVVCDCGTLAHSGVEGFGPIEGCNVKGRQAALEIQRYNAASVESATGNSNQNVVP